MARFTKEQLQRALDQARTKKTKFKLTDEQADTIYALIYIPDENGLVATWETAREIVSGMIGMPIATSTLRAFLRRHEKEIRERLINDGRLTDEKQ